MAKSCSKARDLRTAPRRETRAIFGDAIALDAAGPDDRAQPRPAHRGATDGRPAAPPRHDGCGRRANARSNCSPKCISETRARAARLSAPTVRRHAPARPDRRGFRARAQDHRRRRADDGARRHGAEADPAAHSPDAGGASDRGHLRHPRSRRRRANLRSGDAAVRRRGDRIRRDRRHSLRASPRLYARADRGGAAIRPA